MSDYSTKLLEIHGPNMWNFWHVTKAVELARQLGMTGIVFHCNDLVDRLVMPSAFFPKELSLRRWPVRFHTVENDRYYVNEVIRLCRANDLEFFAEVKELYFPPDIVELYPHLRNEDGAICPTDPFWWEFLTVKYSELVEQIPDLRGVILSVGTRESMASMAANACGCDRCRSYDVDMWYRELINSVFAPLDGADKQLVVRDFAYTNDHQLASLDAAASVSHNITLSLKNTPHDYYPTFPDNPAIGRSAVLAQWVEYDTWGQFYGLGLFPCSIAENMRGRMGRFLNAGATGVMLRTDLESVSQGSVFNSFNLLNLIAGAMLAEDVDTPIEDIYRRWAEIGLLSPLVQDSVPQQRVVPHTTDAVARLQELMTTGWAVLEKAIYVRGHVFHENCQFPDSVSVAFTMMEEFHSREDWEPGAHLRIEPTETNIAAIFLEKREAVRLASTIRKLLGKDLLGVPEGPVHDYLVLLPALFEAYARAFEAIARTCFLVRRAESTQDPVHVADAQATLTVLTEVAGEVQRLVEGQGFSHMVAWSLDHNRLNRLRTDASSRLAEVVPSGYQLAD